MKVVLEPNYKDYYTLTDLEHAKTVIKYEKSDDDYTAKDWADYAVEMALKDAKDFPKRILATTAQTAKHANIDHYDAFGEGSGDMDVWMGVIAETERGFIKIGAYLTDIWETGAKDYRDNMYIEYFAESEIPMYKK